MNLLLEKQNLSEYLQADQEVDWHHPAIEAKAQTLFAGCRDETDAIQTAFDFVCNEIAHSGDIHSHRVTRSASEVLQYGEGICYAKSMLLAALLRYYGIPCGFCYQELRLNNSPNAPLIIHALNAVSLTSLQKWMRLDARGNTNGICAKFVPNEDHLAFIVRPELGEADLRMVYASPYPTVVETLHRFNDCQKMFRHLPQIYSRNLFVFLFQS